MLLALPFPNFDPVLIQLGPFAIRWYALAYIAGILLGWLYARAIIRWRRAWGGPAPMSAIDLDDFIVWVTLGIILGGRIGYVLFYNPAYFAENPMEAFQLWKGGMSMSVTEMGDAAAMSAKSSRPGQVGQVKSAKSSPASQGDRTAKIQRSSLRASRNETSRRYDSSHSARRTQLKLRSSVSRPTWRSSG